MEHCCRSVAVRLIESSSFHNVEAENNRGGLINEDFLPLRREREADNARNRTPLSSFVFLSVAGAGIARRYLDFASDSAAI